MKKYLFVPIFLLLFVSVTFQMNSVAQANALASISGYRLPFVGSKTITEGPNCPFSHGGTEAIDFSNGAIFAVYSATTGDVSDSYFDSTLNNGYSYGNLIKIKDASGNTSYYAHLSVSKVGKGQVVTKGQLIGYSGNTTAGPKKMGIHLHFEVKDSNNNPVSIRNLPGINWTDPNRPCQDTGVVDGMANGEPINNGVALYPLNNYLGQPKTQDSPTYGKIEFPVYNPGSIQIVDGWSAKLYPGVFTDGQCISQSTPSLDAVYMYSFLGVSAMEVFDNPSCTPPQPFNLSCLTQSAGSGMVSAMSIGEGCDPATPTPTTIPGNPTPTPPPSGGNGWSAKAFTKIDECNDNGDCNPSSTFYQTTVSGQNISLNFGNGRAFGAGTSDIWGIYLKQTLNLPSGTYYLHADHDDGVKIWVNGSSKMDVLSSVESNTTCPGIYLSGSTNISILWKNTVGAAHLNFSLDQNGDACQSSQKWHVWYYSDPNICDGPNCNLQQVYCEKDIPGTQFHIDPYTSDNLCGSSDDTWGSMWKQTINFPEGDYVFWASHDDGVKIFLGDTNIMDVGVNQYNDKACPARHLNGNVPVTVIHKNTGGDARINVWWNTDTSVCEQVAYNVWVEKDQNDVTHVKVENGDINKVNLYLYRTGQATEITRSRWTQGSGFIEAVIPSDVDGFMTDQGFVPTIQSPMSDEWYNDAGDPRWVMKKKMFLWLDEQERTHLTYQGDHSRPQIRFYTSGVSGEQLTADLWTDLPDGSGIEAVIPDNYESVKVDRWIRPVVTGSASTWWLESNYWLPKRIITADLVSDTILRVYYSYGTPLPVTLGRYGQEVETRTDLWQQVQNNGHTDYYFDLPSDVVAFEIQGGPKPQIMGWATWLFGNYDLGHWVSQKTSWVYKNADNTTQVFYQNPKVNPADVNVIYYNYGDQTEHQTTSWWTKVDGGLTMTIPGNIESFLITRGPAPLLTDSVTNEWRTVSPDGKWLNHKWLRVSKDGLGKTYVSYAHEQTARPNIHYWANGQETITNTLWQPVGDGIQAQIPDNAENFLIEIWNQPIIEPSAQTTWKFSSLPDLWIELINKPVTPTPTPTPTVVPPEDLPFSLFCPYIRR